MPDRICCGDRIRLHGHFLIPAIEVHLRKASASDAICGSKYGCPAMEVTLGRPSARAARSNTSAERALLPSNATD